MSVKPFVLIGIGSVGAIALIAYWAHSVSDPNRASGAAPQGSLELDLLPTLPATSASASVPPRSESSSLPEAIAELRPAFSDTSGTLDRGSAALAQWASGHLRWSDLRGLQRTSAALFRKDPERERGRLICIDGVIGEIRAERNLARRLLNDRAQSYAEMVAQSPQTAQLVPDAGAPGAVPASAQLLAVGTEDSKQWEVPNGSVYFATLAEVSPDAESARRERSRQLVVAALAVRSSGDLVDGSQARFCGVLTGINLGASPGASEPVVQHRAVGMFELSENVRDDRVPPGVEPSSRPGPPPRPAPASPTR